MTTFNTFNLKLNMLKVVNFSKLQKMRNILETLERQRELASGATPYRPRVDDCPPEVGLLYFLRTEERTHSEKRRRQYVCLPETQNDVFYEGIA